MALEMGGKNAALLLPDASLEWAVKETVHGMIDELPDDNPWLLDLYEKARLKKALDEAEADIKAGRVLTFEEADRRMRAKWAKRDSQSI